MDNETTFMSTNSTPIPIKSDLKMPPPNSPLPKMPPVALSFQNETSPASMEIMNTTNTNNNFTTIQMPMMVWNGTAVNATEDGDNYDDNPEYNELLQIEHAKEREGQNAWAGVILGASFANILVLFVLLMVTRGKRGYFGIRLYTFNLALFALIQISVLFWTAPDDLFGVHKWVAYGVEDFMDKYNGSLLECTQIVFLSATTVLILDSIQRYRNNGIGISKLSWILGILFLDILPMLYIFVKGIRFEYIQIRPKPLAIYHVVVMVIFSLVATFLGLTVICVPFYRCCNRKQEEIVISEDQNRKHAIKQKMWARRLTSNGPPSAKPLSYAKLFCLFLFILCTAWPQYTVFNLGVDLQPGDGMAQAKEFSKEIQSTNSTVGSFVKAMQEARVVYWLMSIQKWAAIFRPFFETFFALLLLLIPSIGSKFQMRKICPTNTENSRSSGEHQNLNSSFTSGVFGQQRELQVALNQLPSAPPMS